MAHVRVVLRQSDDTGQKSMEEFQDAKARIVNSILQVYRPATSSGGDEELRAEFQDAVYLYWRYVD